MFYEVIPDKLFLKNATTLTYASADDLPVGAIVQIPLGRSTTAGIIYKKVTQPAFKTRTITKVLYNQPLPPHLIKTIEFFRDYYLTPFPAALSLILPKGILKSRRKTEQNSVTTTLTPKLPLIPLNKAQKNTLEGLYQAPGRTKLLHGVTGSGKTNIYLEMAKNALKQQKSTILLVPEIALTSQLVRVFEDTFGQKVVLIHSGMTEAERHRTWEQLLLSSVPKIIIGPRSALFAPVRDLGLIIIDECHEQTYYQENSPKYSALRVASAIANHLKITCLLGSATPLVSDYYLAKSKNALVTLNEKAKSSAIAPDIHLIDFKDRANFSKNRYFSTPLLNQITDNLAHHRQTLIFHNRRGSAPLSICEDCGEELLCPTCFLPLTLHADTYQLVCHTCGYHTKVPRTCPHCGSPNILHKGFGTKLLESELKKLFKTAKIARFDADNAKGATLDALYDAVKSGEIDILIGTQSLAKGLDLPHLTTVGVVQADAGLSLPDYSAKERTFELITQVIGRVGRGHTDLANVFVQTFQPDSPTLKYALAADYANFSDYLLKSRQAPAFPPFSYLAKLEITMKTENIVLAKIRALHSTLSRTDNLWVSVPTPAFHERTARGYTWQIIVKSHSRQALLDAITRSAPLSVPHFHLTLDPPSLL